MDTIRPGGRRPTGRRLAAWAAASVLAGGGLAGAGLLAAGPAAADTTACPAAVVSGTTATVTCTYTGGSQYWTVPAGVTQATFTLYGAEGGDGWGIGGSTDPGGLGAEVTGTLTVTPGTLIQVNAGQAGAAGAAGTFGGGGAPGGRDAGGGGGETDVRAPAADGSYPLSDALLVAGGGGGGGDNVTADISYPEGTSEYSTAVGGNADAPGAAGTTAIGDCVEVGGGAGGGAGTTSAGGAGGAGGSTSYSNTGSCSVTDGSDGGAGSTGAGGTGGSESIGESGGGGGGGYYGGGGGGGGAVDYAEGVPFPDAAGGGGGGASYAGSTGATVTDGVAAPDDAPDGEVIITYSIAQPPAFTADSPSLTAATGTPYSYQFTASGTPAPSYALAAGAPSWLSVGASTGLVSGTPSADTTSFSYSVVASNAAGSVTAGPFTVAVSNKADVSASLSCPSSLTVGGTGTCTLTVANAGPAQATTVLAGVTVPGTLQVTGCSDGCSQKDGALGWSLGSLAAGQSDSLTVDVTAVRAGTAIVAAADGSVNPDPNLLNNLAATTIKITA